MKTVNTPCLILAVLAFTMTTEMAYSLNENEEVAIASPTPTPTSSLGSASARPTPVLIVTGHNPTPTPTNYCCEKAKEDYNWDDSSTLFSVCFGLGNCVTTGMCYIAEQIAYDALEWAEENYVGGERKAARHAYWNLRMVEELSTFESISSCAAKAISDAYEVSNPNPCEVHYQDVRNNSVGRSLANQPGTIKQRIDAALLNGSLQTQAGCA